MESKLRKSLTVAPFSSSSHDEVKCCPAIDSDVLYRPLVLYASLRILRGLQGANGCHYRSPDCMFPVLLYRGVTNRSPPLRPPPAANSGGALIICIF